VHQVGDQPRLYYDAGQPIIKEHIMFKEVKICNKSFPNYGNGIGGKQ
jgi:hypothetical protein